MNILVVGGRTGYGKGIADFLKSENHNVIVASRGVEDGKSFKQCDVTDNESVIDLFDEIKDFDLDVVVYCAGLAIGKSPIETGIISNWNKVFQTNTIGLLNVSKQAIPLLKKSKGIIIHLGSIAHELSYYGGADYCASKAASHTIMKTLRTELLGTDVRVTAIEPGMGETEFHRVRYSGDENKAKKHYDGVRQLQPEDLGSLVNYIINLPSHVNIDEVTIKPIDQLTHGKTTANNENPF